MVTYFDACEILEMLSEASVKVFLDGGWGVDALIGRETRIHNDIDLFVEKKDYGKAISVITWKGYREVVMDYTTDSHTVWKDDNGRIIDLHCFEYVEDGILYDGYTFPSETFSGKGNIGNH
ncbi:nucleotidyltransferase family protein [Prevotella sp. P4-98]|uniref:nucleotidyltransferase family protein n=1 Tax=Prevotella sp. P4-98 TaxID=2024219 RepID=UPI0020B12D33|nr:nucleotidyltransferase family protein [Prevotella sp. P4-98]